MFSKYILPLIALAGVGYSVFSGSPVREDAEPASPSRSSSRRPRPDTSFAMIAGVGPDRGAEREHPDRRDRSRRGRRGFRQSKRQYVKAGDPLFRIDDRELKAEAYGPRGRT